MILFARHMPKAVHLLHRGEVACGRALTIDVHRTRTTHVFAAVTCAACRRAMIEAGTRVIAALRPSEVPDALAQALHDEVGKARPAWLAWAIRRAAEPQVTT